MEKKDKREFTNEEVLAIVKHCSDIYTGCNGCPANNMGVSCHDSYADSIKRLVSMYEEKCKELKEWQESHARCIEDIRERGEREVDLERFVRSYQDQYIESREECDDLHKEIARLKFKLSIETMRANKRIDLIEENDQLKADKEELLTAHKHLIQLRDDYRAYVPKLTEANNNLKAENEDLNAQVKSLSDKLAELENENKKIKEAREQVLDGVKERLYAKFAKVISEVIYGK